MCVWCVVCVCVCVCVCVSSCMCNIVCNGHNDNPVCGSDGVTYDTPCHVREASCLKQLKIDIKHVGRCQGNQHTHLSDVRGREGEGEEVKKRR